MMPLDIDRLVEDLGLDAVGARSDWLQLNCPFCNDTKHHLGYNRTSGRLNCFRCGPIDLRAWLEAVSSGQEFGEILREYRLIRLKPPETARKRVIPSECRLPPCTSPLGPRHARYLRMRGFSPNALAKTWNLVGTGHIGGKWQWRVIAPVLVDGRPVSYQGRDITGTSGRKRWLAADQCDEVMPLKRTLYGLNLAQPERPLLVVEGPPNCWRMGPGTVGTCGTTVTIQQEMLIRRWKAGAIIAFDPEPKAQQQAEHLANQLADHVPVKLLLMDDYEDIAAMPQAEADKLKKEVWP